MLRKAKVEGKIEYYCLTTTWVEIIGKVIKELYRKHIGKETIDIALKSLR